MSKKDFRAAAQNYQGKDFDPTAGTAGKLPVNISGGKEVLSDFMSIPVEKLTPYRAKNGFDFSRHTPVLEETMVDSIRNYGVIEPITVRATDSGEYEILAGESRWLAAQKAGLVKVPCHVLSVDDIHADAVFAATNLIRRDMSYRDRINGWWRYTEDLRKENRLSELRRALDENEELVKTIVNGESLGWRQIMRYTSCHNLISEWIDRLDNRSVGFMVAYEVSMFPKDIQTILLKYHFTEGQIKRILEVYRKSADGDSDVVWNGEETIASLLAPDQSATRFTRSVRNRVVRAAEIGLREEDYVQADEIITKALALYYESVSPEKASSDDQAAT